MAILGLQTSRPTISTVSQTCQTYRIRPGPSTSRCKIAPPLRQHCVCESVVSSWTHRMLLMCSRRCEQATHLLVVVHRDVQVDAGRDQIRMTGR
jgi:hypothetical protein